MNLRAIVFDFDGTLIDSALECAEIFNTILIERGERPSLNPSDLQGLLSIGGTYMVRHALGKACKDPEADLLLFRKIYSERSTPQDCLYEGCIEILEKTRERNIDAVICTKKPEKLTHKIIKDLKMDRYFKAISCGDSTNHPKPDKRHLLSVLENIHCSPDEAIMVGDSIIDQELSDNSGVRFVFARYGYGKGEVYEPSCYKIIDKPHELTHLL